MPGQSIKSPRLRRALAQNLVYRKAPVVENPFEPTPAYAIVALAFPL